MIFNILSFKKVFLRLSLKSQVSFLPAVPDRVFLSRIQPLKLETLKNCWAMEKISYRLKMKVEIQGEIYEEIEDITFPELSAYYDKRS